MYSILVVEDNEHYLTTIVEILRDYGYDVDCTMDPIGGIEMCSKKLYDLVISDLVMKEMDGLRFVGIVRNIIPTIKTMILTGNPTEETENASIDADVDYYMSKDKSLTTVLKYVEQLLRKDTQQVKEKNQILLSREEKIEVNENTRTVIKNGVEVYLTPKEFRLLVFFLENKGVAFSRDEIIDNVWDEHVEEVDERIVDVHVKKLRQKLNTFSIMSIRGYGYKWNE